MQISRLMFYFLSAALLLCAAVPSRAQDFSISATDFSPSPVDENSQAAATLTLQPLNGFNGQVNLQCAVSPLPANAPTCLVSQSTVTPPAQPTVSLITTANSPPGLYTVTVTASSAATTLQVPLTDTVVGVTPDYTISIGTAISPTSVHAGSGATVVLDVTPVSYSGTVTLVCSAISPAVEFSPICTFNPPSITVTGAAPVQSTLTISTTGPATTTTTSLGRRSGRRLALWLLLPGFAFCGFSLQRKTRGTPLRWIFLALLLACVALLPSCNTFGGSSSNTNKTPNNTYSITISAVDANQVGPSNSSVVVTLTVN